MKDFFDDLDNELKGVNTSNNSLNQDDIQIIEDDTVEGEAIDVNESFTESSMKSAEAETVASTEEKKSSFKKEFSRNTKDFKEWSNNSDSEFTSLKYSLMTNFPETKFYLPTLREGYTRMIPIWGHNEVGKNMSMYQYGEDIVLIDGGMQFPEADMLGAKYSIPDISFLIPYKDKIKGFIITHGHLDHIGALKHLLPALGMPPVYGTKLTIGFIKKNLEENNLLNSATLIEIDQDKEEFIRMWNWNVEFFRENHSIPDATGIYLESPNAKIVHTWDFKFDFTPAVDKPADLARIGRIGSRGVTVLMSDSTNATKKWFTKSEKEIGISLEHLIEKGVEGRMIIATFSSLVWRIQQIVEACERHNKTVFLSGRSMVENVRIARDLGFVKSSQSTIKKMTGKATEGIPLNKQVIITTGSQGEEFSALYRIAEGTHPSIEVMPGDTIVLSSTPIPGNERSVVEVMNKLIRLGAKLVTNDNLDIHASGHAAQEEQKIMLNLIRPKNFIPIHGELFMRVAHKNTAMELGHKDENIFLSDNGNILDIAPDGKIFRSKIQVPLQEIIVDGNGIGTAGSHVIKAREKMMNSWVLVIGFKIDSKTKAIVGPLKIETRGLVYIDEVRQIHKMIIKKAKTVYENTVMDVPEIEEKDLVKIIKADLESYLLQKIDREPMIIPIITEV